MIEAFAKFKKDTIKSMEDTVKKSISTLCERVSSDTPVDTSRCVRSWRASTGRPKYIYLTNKEASILKSKREKIDNKIEPTLKAMKLGEVFYFSNNTPYAQYLEYDFTSQQAPKGFVRINTARWEEIVYASRT